MGPTTRLKSALSVVAMAAMLGAAALPLSAQAAGTVRGRVTDAATQRPLSGAQVSVVGSSRRAVTNASGEYTLGNVPAGALTVRAELLGYGATSRSVTLEAGQTATANFALSQSALALDALVVTGTPGATEKRTLGNAVTSVSAAEITDRTVVANVAQLLQARSPGLTIMPGSGVAGTASSIRIRGTGSVSAGSQPIVYIDGIRMQSGTFNPGVAGQQISALNSVNPEDIESIEVIKGPAAATLYGAEAAAGVIQIITKKGKTGDQGVQFSVRADRGTTEWGVEMPTNYLNCSNARVRASAPSAGTYFAGCANIDTIAHAPNTQGRIITDQPLWRAIDDGSITNLSASARGGGERYSFFLAGDKDEETGIFSNNWTTRNSGRGNFYVSMRDNLDVSVNLSGSRTEFRLPLTDNASNGWLRNAFRAYPGVKLASAFAEGWRGLSPAEMRIFDNRTRRDRYIMGVTTNYQPVSWFRNRLTLGLDASTLRNTEYFRKDRTGRLPYGSDRAEGYIYQQVNEYQDYTIDYAGTVARSLPWSLESETSFGLQFLGARIRSLAGEGIGLEDGVKLVSNATSTQGFESFTEQNSVGLFVQQQVGWQDRLFITGALRVDDNSTFGENFDYQVYPKAMASYVISEEPFFNVPMVDELKLRFAWGQAGNSPAAFERDQTQATSTVILDNGTASSAFIASNFGNPDITAETGEEFEVGFDASLLNDRMGLELTYYDKTTHEALLPVPVAPSSGFGGSVLRNIGEINNKGLEIALNGTPIQSSAVRLESRLAFSTNKNRFISFGGSRDNSQPILYGSTDAGQQVREGYPLAGYWVVDFQRNPDGSIKVNENPTTGALTPLFEDTATYVGSPVPNREASMTQTLTLFGNLQLYAFVDYKGGHYLYNLTQQFRDNDGNTWETVNPDTSYANRLNRVGRGFTSDARYIEPADFVKLREVSLTYNVPQSLVRRFGTDDLSLTVAGRNLAQWTRFSGYDPELNFSGPTTFSRTAYMTVPALRTWVASVNVRF